MKKGLVAKVYEVKVLPNTIKELVEAIYVQTGRNKIFLSEALEMAEFLEQERYTPKPITNTVDMVGKVHKVK
jgi:predicted metal-dependent hydrolase